MSIQTTETAFRPQPLDQLFDAVYHGKWRFDDFAEASVRANTVSKTYNKAGKIRHVLVASEKLKAWHDFLRLVLLDFLPINKEVVFSYRKGLSSYDAVARHAKSKAFFVCDIANFFPSVRQSRIRKAVLTALGACPIQDFEIWLDRIVDLVCLDDKLPVGFSTSPPISNATLTPFDNAFQEYCETRGWVLSRYSDDIIVSSQDAAELNDAQNQVALFLRDTMDEEFSLNTRKSRFLNRGNKVKLLGLVLLPNGKVSVDSSVKSLIEVLVHFYLWDKEKFMEMSDGDPRKAESRLSGLLNHVNTVDQVYLDKLRKKFGASVVDYFLHRSFS